MSEWDATTYAAKDNLLRVVRREADALFEMAENGPWTGATACPKWEARDIVGHLIDVTESYFVGFDAARSGTAAADPLGVRVMQDMLDEGAKEHRRLSQAEAVDRLRTDFGKMMEIFEALGPEVWGGLVVPHEYWGPLPAFVTGGPHNPMGARGLYLYSGNKDTLYRIHGTNQPEYIGQAISSGCIRMTNEDVVDLYNRVKPGTMVVVLPPSRNASAGFSGGSRS